MSNWPPHQYSVCRSETYRFSKYINRNYENNDYSDFIMIHVSLRVCFFEEFHDMMDLMTRENVYQKLPKKTENIKLILLSRVLVK